MKCPNCGGKGYWQEDMPNKFMGRFKQTKFWECSVCHGSGEIKEITNEEWFTSLSTEEKAKRIINIAVNSDCDYRTIVEWLKQPHTAK